MKEIKGELFDYLLKPRHVVCITTNGFVKGNGQAVMGRGCALQASIIIEDLPKLLGQHLQEKGNHVAVLPISLWKKKLSIVTFPVKHNWWEDADLQLIGTSAYELAKIAGANKGKTYILPRPGCGNGRRNWEKVKKVIAPILPDNVCIITWERREDEDEIEDY